MRSREEQHRTFEACAIVPRTTVMLATHTARETTARTSAFISARSSPRLMGLGEMSDFYNKFK